MHGVNLDQLGRRDPDSLRGADAAPRSSARSPRPPSSGACSCASSRPTTRASSSSTCTVSQGMADGLILNPGAWTHYAWAIRDALELAGVPAVEVHLSDVDNREPWRRHSVLEGLCVGRVAGRGPRRLRRGARHPGAGARPDERRARGAARRPASIGPGSTPARHRAGERPLPDRVHRQQRPGAGRARPPRVRHRLPLRRAGRRGGRPRVRPPPRGAEPAASTCPSCSAARRSGSASRPTTCRWPPTGGSASCAGSGAELVADERPRRGAARGQDPRGGGADPRGDAARR